MIFFGLKISEDCCCKCNELINKERKYKVLVCGGKIFSIKNSPLTFDELSYRMAQTYSFDKQATIDNSYHFIVEYINNKDILISPERESDYTSFYNGQNEFIELFNTVRFE